MTQVYTEDKVFEKGDYTVHPLPKGEYDHCRFVNCDFSGSLLSESKFISCDFEGCNLSLAKLVKTTLNEVTFKDCKLLGLHFDSCNPFGLSFRFEQCRLDHSSFYETKIRKTVFRKCGLLEVDFTACDLTESVFDDCDLLRAKFENTLLEKADFRSAFHYSIDPALNRVKKAKFSQAGIAGLLDRYDILIED